MAAEDEVPPPLTPVVLHVLLALADGPLHGYAIMKRVEEDSGLAMGPGTVYGSLQRLEDLGWIREQAAQAEGDPRRGPPFCLTAAGRRALEGEGRRLARLSRMVAARHRSPDPAEAS